MANVPLLLVDGHNLLWRAWYGFPARIRSRDKTRDLTGVFGFFALLRVATRDLPSQPEIVVVFDGENAWDVRQEIHPQYKAHRPTDEAAMAPIKQLANVVRGLDSTGINHVCLDTEEADDVIATLVHHTRRDTWIMSCDRDFYQLVDSKTRILNTTRRSDQRVIDMTGIEKCFGITPSQWCDRASLVGDRSDGIPGVRGVGGITAGRLLGGGLTIEDLPGSGRLQGKLGARIRQQWSDIERWKSLTQLRKDLEVDPPKGTASPELPPAPRVLEALDLW